MCLQFYLLFDLLYSDLLYSDPLATKLWFYAHNNYIYYR